MAYEHLQGKRILIVDDNPGITYRLRINFEALHCDVMIANDVATAEQATNIDVAIVDMFIPEIAGVSDSIMRGVQLCETLHRAMPRIKIVAISEELDAPPRSASGHLIHHFLSKEYLPTGKRPDALFDIVERLLLPTGERKPRMFIVHAQQDATAVELKNYLQNTLGLGPAVLLAEIASAGRSIIEKFEEVAYDIDLVFVVATPDDTVQAPTPLIQPRQNVLFELGYFYASLRRRSGKIIVLRKGDVALPSDISGIGWVDITHGVQAAGEDIRRELRKADWLS